jgi:hypothetical protein
VSVMVVMVMEAAEGGFGDVSGSVEGCSRICSGAHDSCPPRPCPRLSVCPLRHADASATGAPVMRPMFYDFWDQPTAAAADDQMMFGPNYLVAPQLQEEALQREVWLPQLPSEFVWRNVFSGKVTNTSAAAVTITEATPLSGDGLATFPLYFRAPVT